MPNRARHAVPCLLAAVLVGVGMGADPVARVVVKGRGVALGETPVAKLMKVELEPGAYVLKGGPAGPIPATVFNAEDHAGIAFTLPSVPAAGETVYTLERAPLDRSNVGGLKLEAFKPGLVEVTLDGKPFASIDSRTGPKPFLHPLYAPSGRPITRAFPMENVDGEKRDHPHHRSVWFTHGKVNGIDFWTEARGHGTIVETSRTTSNTPALCGVYSRDEWKGPDGKVVLKSERAFRFYATKGPRILDVDIELTAQDAPVVFGDTKEGTFGVRVASSMDVDAKGGGKITTSEGLTDADAWGKHAKWVDYSGPLGGETAGIAILNHPDSFRYPTAWHVRTYGLFAANPFGLHDFGEKAKGDYTLSAGASIHFTYRLILHPGDAASANIPAAFAAYAEPPEVTVTKLD